MAAAAIPASTASLSSSITSTTSQLVGRGEQRSEPSDTTSLLTPSAKPTTTTTTSSQSQSATAPAADSESRLTNTLVQPVVATAMTTRASRSTSPGRHSLAQQAAMQQLSPNAAKQKAKAAENAITLQREMEAAIAKLPNIVFPANPEVAARLQADDLQDDLLMRICSALASVGNRALCPKEIAEVCKARGWVCKGTQPFAIISTCIRSHLRRRGITTLSDGLPVRLGAPPPLLTSFELHTALDVNEVLAVGVDKDAKPTVKRGTLWFLSSAGAGFANPFGDNGLSDSARMKQKLASEAKALQKSSNTARRSSLPAITTSAAVEQPAYDVSFGRQPSVGDDYDEAMGRGKRKRKASSIAGGDSAWHAAPMATSGRPLETVPESPTLQSRRAGSTDSALSPHPSSRTQSRRLKLRLGQTASTASTADAELSDYTSGEDEAGATLQSRSLDTGTLAAIEKRRYKKRSKSEGSLLQPSTMHHYHLAGDRSASASFSTSPTDSLWGSLRRRGGALSDGTYFRGSSVDWADTSMDNDVEMSSGTEASKPVKAREDEEEDDFHEAMLNSDFDFEFDFAANNRAMRDGRRALPLDFDEAVSTPATSPESLSPSFKEEETDYDTIANGPSGVGADEVEFEMEDQLLGLKEATLTEDCADDVDDLADLDDALLSPAPELPVLPLMSAAMSVGFAPAGLAPSEEEVLESGAHRYPADSYRSNSAITFSRSLSPATSFTSSISSVNSAAPSRMGSPTVWSDADSFDAEVIVGPPSADLPDRYTSVELETAPYPFSHPVEAELPASLRIEELDLDWGEDDDSDHHTESSRQPPPTPFGPEVFGFITTPRLDWQPAPEVTCSENAAELDLAFEPAADTEDVEMADNVAAASPASDEAEAPAAKAEPMPEKVLKVSPGKADAVSPPTTRAGTAAASALVLKRNTASTAAKQVAPAPARTTRATATAQVKQEQQRPVEAAVERRASLRSRKR